MRIERKEMTETRGLEVKRINVRPTQTNNIQTHRRRAVKKSASISSMSTHKLNENMTIKMNSNKDSILTDDQSTLRQIRYTTI